MRWLGFINLALAGVILLTVALFLFSRQEENPLVFIARPEQKELPKSPFAETEEFFQEIDEGTFALKWVPPQMQLPDLRQELVFYGKNLRPDALRGFESYHVALKGSGEKGLIQEGERVYLVYQGSNEWNWTPPESDNDDEDMPSESDLQWGEKSREEANGKNRYTFSPGNQPTPLWLEARALNDQRLEIRVSMLDEKGVLVTTPQDLRCFACQAQEFPKSQIIGWDLGGNRVDGTLLVRQKARWVGPDLFLELHGGEEYQHVLGKERIDFLNGENSYSCFIALNDLLVWKENRWAVAEEGEETQNRPIMVVKKIDDKMMSFELWDAEGKGRTFLSLLHAREPHGTVDVAQELKFVGAKTWAQFIVESRNGVRMTLKLHDWLVLTPEGWQKLDSVEQIDSYVSQKLAGPLFILDKMVKQNGKQVLIGHLFNTSRTEVEQVELTSSSRTSLANFYVPPSPVHTEPLIEGNK